MIEIIGEDRSVIRIALERLVMIVGGVLAEKIEK